MSLLRERIKAHPAMAVILAVLTIAGTSLHWLATLLDWISRWDTLSVHFSYVIKRAALAAGRMPAWAPECLYAVSLLVVVGAFSVTRRNRTRQQGGSVLLTPQEGVPVAGFGHADIIARLERRRAEAETAAAEERLRQVKSDQNIWPTGNATPARRGTIRFALENPDQREKDALEKEKLKLEVEEGKERLRQTQLATQSALRPACIVIEHDEYYLEADEEGPEQWNERLRFSNVGGEVARQITVDEFTIGGAPRRIQPPISVLLPNAQPVDRMTSLKDALDRQNITRRIFRKKPVGVAITVRYYGIDNQPQLVAKYVIIRDTISVHVDPMTNSIGEWVDVSGEPPEEAEAEALR
jgi:hypothetical protein